MAFANMNVNPNTNLRIVRQLADPYDLGTNYVRAVVRNSATGAVLDTVNLTDEGSQRFSGFYHTNADPSGVGYYIDVTTTVFTDAGYTTKSENYQVETNTYHVIQQFGPGMGLGGGADVNYEKVRRIVQEELAKLVIPEPVTPPDLTPVLLGLEQRLTKSVGAIKIPEQKEVDLEPVMQEVRTSVDNAINTLLLAVDGKEVTPPTDISPVLEAINDFKATDLQAGINAIQGILEPLEGLLARQDDVEGKMESTRQAAQEFLGTLSTKKKQEPEEDMTRVRARKLLGI